jgi:hypothetical protein
MKKTALIIEGIALLGSIVWLIVDFDFEPGITCLGLISSMVITFFIKSKEGKGLLTESSDNHQRLINGDKIKLVKRILFIDDENFLLVKILKQAGWINTKWIKDVIDLDNNDVKASDIIFIDINGVGKNLYPKDQGLGLAVGLKTKYPDKAIIIYSAENQRVHRAFSIVDACLPKDADPYEFEELINNFSKSD